MASGSRAAMETRGGRRYRPLTPGSPLIPTSLRTSTPSAQGTHGGVDFAQGAKWTDKIKASPFSGGVDPKRIQVELEAEASTRGGSRRIGNRKQKTDELAKAHKEELDLETRRAQVLSAEMETIASAEALDAVDKEIAKDKRKVEELERILAQGRPSTQWMSTSR